jgi:hypothetical protein
MTTCERTKQFLISQGWDLRKSTPKDTDAICSAFVTGISCNPIRGVRAKGVCGCGKTMALSILYRVRTNGLAVVIDCLNAHQVEALENAIDFDLRYNRNGGIVILDDLGREPKIEFKNAHEIVGAYICRKYSAWKQGVGGGIAITTNLSIPGDAGLIAIYGDHVVSRICEMTVGVQLETKDQREFLTV